MEPAKTVLQCRNNLHVGQQLLAAAASNLRHSSRHRRTSPEEFATLRDTSSTAFGWNAPRPSAHKADSKAGAESRVHAGTGEQACREGARPLKSNGACDYSRQ
jgi:hypothetical protein